MSGAGTAFLSLTLPAPPMATPSAASEAALRPFWREADHTGYRRGAPWPAADGPVEAGRVTSDPPELAGLAAHLEMVRFREGSCLMREGSPGDACYVIVAGEVRVEVERPDFDSNGVVSFMGPGAVCGELRPAR